MSDVPPVCLLSQHLSSARVVCFHLGAHVVGRFLRSHPHARSLHRISKNRRLAPKMMQPLWTQSVQTISNNTVHAARHSVSELSLFYSLPFQKRFKSDLINKSKQPKKFAYKTITQVKVFQLSVNKFMYPDKIKTRSTKIQLFQSPISHIFMLHKKASS